MNPKSYLGLALSCLSFSLSAPILHIEAALSVSVPVESASWTPKVFAQLAQIPPLPKNPIPQEFTTVHYSTTFAPLVAACPFPAIPLSESTYEAYSGYSIGLSSPSSSTSSFTRGDGSDSDLGMTVNHLLNEGKLEQALEVAQRMQSVSAQDDSLLSIVNAYVEAEQLERALSIALMISISEDTDVETVNVRDSALGSIFRAYLSHGQLDSALQVAESMGEFQVSNLLDLVGAFYTAHQPERATKILNQSLELYRTQSRSGYTDSPPLNDFINFYTLSRFAGLYLTLDQPEQGVQLMDEAIAIARRFPSQDLTTLSILNSLADFYIQAEAKDKAAALLSEIVQATETLDEPFVRAVLLARVAATYGNRLEHLAPAADLLSQAQALVNSETEPSRRNLGFGEIAMIYGSLGQYETASEIAGNLEPDSLQEQFQQALTCAQTQAEL